MSEKKKTKLELTWIGKDNKPKLEPRVLLEDQEKSYHAEHRVSDDDIFDNKLIFGDNLLALKALEQEYTGKVKCIYIDPPYNTGNAFEHYDDGLEHSIWLGLMRDRLVLLRSLLTDDGSIWISIDDDESHYLKVLCDEIFGRQNFVANVIWQKKFSAQADAKWLSDSHDHIIVVAKNKELFKPNLLIRTHEANTRYKNIDDDPRGAWMSSDMSVKTYSKTTDYTITTPSGRKVNPPESRCWAFSKDKLDNLINDNRIWFGKNGNGVPRIKRFLSEVKNGMVCMTLWFHEEVGHNQEAKKEVKQFNNKDVFATPKPERLLERIVHLSTNKGDLILDSFAGSGTTAAVAHKMGRKWITIELGEHCHTHIIPRLKKVINNEDNGGITNAVNWKGGGGFRYYTLAPTLIVTDPHGNQIINPEFNPSMLAEAMCKIEGFNFNPNPEIYWQQGHSTETDFIYVTTQFMSKSMLEQLSEEIGEDRSLLICCSAFKVARDSFSNITLIKIPKAVLKKCEWGHDDYSLEVKNLPAAPEEIEVEKSIKSPDKNSATGSLFDSKEE